MVVEMKKFFWGGLAAAMVIMVMATALAAAPIQSQLIAMRTVKPPLVDGRLDDACWRDAPEAGAFRTLVSRQASRFSTSVRCLYDAQNLYLAFSCGEDARFVKQAVKSNNGPVWDDSSIEVFLAPDPLPAALAQMPPGLQHLQLAFNAAAVRFAQLGHAGTASWPESWTIKTRGGPRGWKAEVAIPFASLGVTAPQPLTVWHVQIGRSAYDGQGGENSTLFPCPTSAFATQSSFGRLVFAGTHFGDHEKVAAAIREDTAAKIAQIDKDLASVTDLGDAALQDKATAMRGQYTRQLAQWSAHLNWADYIQERDTVIARMRQMREEAVNLRRQAVTAYLASHDLQMAVAPHPPLIDHLKVLPTDFPDVRRCGQPVALTMARDSYEPASLVLWTPRAVSNMHVTVTPLASSSGTTLPADAVDVKWVKCWYQAGDTSIHKTGAKVLTPELLLHNPELVKVDLVHQKNIYLPHSTKPGPHGIPFDYPDDADELQPLPELPAYFSQQMWLTVHIPANIAPGEYRSTVTINGDNIRPVRVPLTVKVLNFNLARPPLDMGIYHVPSVWVKGNEPLMRVQMQDMLAHGIAYPGFRCEDPERDLSSVVAMMKETGLPTDRLYILTYRIWVAKDGRGAPTEQWGYQWAKKYVDVAKAAGAGQVYLYLMDEATGKTLAAERSVAAGIHRAGARTWAACYNSYFPEGGDFIDVANLCGAPVGRELLDKIHARGARAYNYSNPQCGIEYPEVYRRNYGLLLWQHGYDGGFDFGYYCAFGDAWNDFDDDSVYRDHNMVYPTLHGVVDTIEWAGWREGTTDLRYLGTLLETLHQAKAAGRSDVARHVEAWLQKLRQGGSAALADLGTVRADMIQLIEMCRTDQPAHVTGRQ